MSPVPKAGALLPDVAGERHLAPPTGHHDSAERERFMGFADAIKIGFAR